MKLNLCALPIGTPVYGIDDRQQVIRGTLGRQFGAIVTIETELGPGVSRRRLFHSRYVTRDWWQALAELP